MKHFAFVFGALIVAAGCATPEGGVANKVLADFGIGEHPEGYVSGSDKVYEQLSEVGASEMKRLNAENRLGEIKYEQEGLRGTYFKEVKVYEDYYPLDAAATTTGSMGERGFSGYIEYSYRVYQSPRMATRIEAESATATIPTDDEGREQFRYKFNTGGVWDGTAGERVRR